jgi:hypothetical protein
MKFDLNSFKQDDTKKTDGVWVDIGAGARIKVASLSSEKFQAWFRKKTAPYTRMNKEIPSDTQKEIMIEGISEYVLFGWEGVYEGETLLPFSIANARRVMTEVEWFVDRVIEEARLFSNFAAEEAAAVEKN